MTTSSITSSIGDLFTKVLLERVATLISEEHLLLPDTANPWSKENYQYLKHQLKERVSPRRFKHSKGVAKTARALARCYGFDADKARIAGILHDWDKGLNNEAARARVGELGLTIDPMVVRDMPWLLHGPTAAAALERACPELGSEVFSAIAHHTSGTADMRPLDCIIYLADIIEPNRTYGDADGIEHLRSLVGKVSLEQLYFEAFKYTLAFLVDQDRLLYPGTIDIWNALMARFGDLARMKRAGQL